METAQRYRVRTAEDPMAAHMAEIAERGDRAAFASCFDHYAPRVKAYLRRLGADEAVAEDLVQEVMLTVWRRAAQFDSRRASVGTWIFTIARNKRIDMLRHERRPEFDPEDPALTGETDQSADQAVEAAEYQTLVRAALATLPAQQAELIRRSYYEDQPHSVIANELSLPLGTVKSRLRLAMQKLRRALKDLE